MPRQLSRQRPTEPEQAAAEGTTARLSPIEAAARAGTARYWPSQPACRGQQPARRTQLSRASPGRLPGNPGCPAPAVRTQCPVPAATAARRQLRRPARPAATTEPARKAAPSRSRWRTPNATKPEVPSRLISPMVSPASVSLPSSSGDVTASRRITSRPPAPAMHSPATPPPTSSTLAHHSTRRATCTRRARAVVGRGAAVEGAGAAREDTAVVIVRGELEALPAPEGHRGQSRDQQQAAGDHDHRGQYPMAPGASEPQSLSAGSAREPTAEAPARAGSDYVVSCASSPRRIM